MIASEVERVRAPELASEEAATYKIESIGTSATERLLSLVLLGVSLAVLVGLLV